LKIKFLAKAAKSPMLLGPQLDAHHCRGRGHAMLSFDNLKNSPSACFAADCRRAHLATVDKIDIHTFITYSTFQLHDFSPMITKEAPCNGFSAVEGHRTTRSERAPCR